MTKIAIDLTERQVNMLQYAIDHYTEIIKADYSQDYQDKVDQLAELAATIKDTFHAQLFKKYIIIRVDAKNDNELWELEMNPDEFERVMLPFQNEGYCENNMSINQVINFVQESLGD